VFSAEMPDERSHAIPPLDADTAERLLSGRLDPDDAPPGYAKVARLLRAAAALADQVEPTGETAAVNAFRTTLPRGRPAQGPAHPTRRPGRSARPQGRPGGLRGRRGAARERASGARGRLVAVALAGVVAVGGVGVWTAGGAPFSRELRSPSGGPSAGGAGSGTPGSGVNGAGTAGSLRPSRSGLHSAPGTAPVAGDHRPALPTPRERATARHGGGVTARGGGPAQGVRPTGPDEPAKPKSQPPKPKSPKPKSPKPKEPKADASKPRTPKADASKPKTPEGVGAQERGPEPRRRGGG
jgi:hypothetical protein